MSIEVSSDADLSDDWIDRAKERPPTLKFSDYGSYAGSVNILAETTQKWNNISQIVSKDLLTKQTKPLTSLFEPPEIRYTEKELGAVEQSDDLDGLSVVQEEQEEEKNREDIPCAENQEEAYHLWLDEDKENSDAETVRPGTMRSSEGLIPNFSFPMTMSQQSLRPEQSEPPLGDLASGTNNNIRSASDPSQTTLRQTVARQSSSAMSETDFASTPRKDTHKSSHSTSSPTKSPLKLFHAEQDTFTRDHAARMIGMLSAVAAPTMQPLKSENHNVQTQKSSHSAVSAMSETTDPGPERKKVKTHEHKGSVTLQNFNDNADRLAAKLRAKGGGLGKGLPRVLEDNKVILGRRISSAAERLDQTRKKERSGKPAEAASGFEDVKIPEHRFSSASDFGAGSKKSHFSDWESEANTESRRTSTRSAVQTDDAHEKPAEKTEPQRIFDSVRQQWTQTPGKLHGDCRPHTAPDLPVTRENRQGSTTSNNHGYRQSPRIKNFPPEAVETLRYGDMIFSTKKQCWKHINESDSEEDPFAESQNTKESGTSTIKHHEKQSSSGEYPDEIDVSLTDSQSSDLSNAGSQSVKDPVQRRKTAKFPVQPTAQELGHQTHVSSTKQQQEEEEEEEEDEEGEEDQQEPSLLVKKPEFERSAFHACSDVADYEDELANLTADMTMSYSTAFLVKAISKRYGEGPWENIKQIDLSGLELESLVGLEKMFPNLTSLDISKNRITSLSDLPNSVQFLKANDNKLTSYRTSFGHLRNLESLDLSNNLMDDLDSFQPLSHLRHLQISNNRLVCIDGLRHLNNIVSVEANGNMLVDVDFIHMRAFNTLHQLERLNLANNELKKLTGIEYLEALYELNVNHNCLQILTITKAMPHLKVLKATNNRLAYVDLGQLDKTRVIYLDDNEITEISHHGCLKHIEVLSLRRQRSTRLSVDFEVFCEVRKLFLSGNSMESFRLDKVFHSLKYLELAGVQLPALPTNLARMVPNLRVLNLSNNELDNIEALIGLDRLERLMLPNNKLSSARELAEVLTCLPRLKALDLRANTYTSRFYAPITPGHETDYFANFDGVRGDIESMNIWLQEDEKFSSTLSDSMKKRREAYQNLIWAVCRSLRWHDGRVPETQQLLMADEYLDTFTQESLLSSSQ